jgi:dipeptide transport system ATP-binding protein
MSALELTDVVVDYERRGGGRVRAVAGASISVESGQIVGLVGESGCGKSTLARAAVGLVRPTSGTVVFEGRDIAPLGRRGRSRELARLQLVFQNPYASLNPRKKVGTLLEEPLAINAGIDKAARRAAARAMMAKVGLRPEHYRRYPHMFSGGQRQRIAVARALMLNPKLVVADEPVSALDVSIQAQVLNLMMDLQQEMGIAYLFISHNLQVVRHIADAIAVMYLGKIVEYGSKADVFARPAHPYTRSLLASTPRLRRDASRTGSAVTGAGIDTRRERAAIRGEPPSPLSQLPGCAFHKRCPYAIERCRVEVPPLEPLGKVLVACHRAAEIAG